MKNFTAFLFLWISAAACEQKAGDHPGTKQSTQKVLLDVDKAFSDMSEAKGMKNAFIEFIDSNGVLLRPNHFPIVGADAIDYLIQQNDSDYILTWKPRYAEAAASGELGYTFGVYELRLRSKDTILYGSYVSIWKKQKDGKWKFVLDTGNEGVDNE